MNNFWTRTLTGAVFVSVMIGCIWWSFWSMAGLFLVISVLGLWEFYSLLEKNNSSPQKITGIIISVIMGRYFISLLASKFSTLLSSFFGIFIPVSMLIFFIELFRNKQLPFQNIGYTFLGLLYVQIPFLLLSSLAINTHFSDFTNSHQQLFTPYIILGFFFLIWANDTFAYLVGISIGKHRLFERHSPKKSWEGFIGGIICTQGIAYLISIYFTDLAMIHWLVIALIVSVFGTMGDLVESMFKRSLGVKDSGNILPGHGGILDRFDGVLLSSPFIFAYLMLVR